MGGLTLNQSRKVTAALQGEAGWVGGRVDGWVREWVGGWVGGWVGDGC